MKVLLMDHNENSLISSEIALNYLRRYVSLFIIMLTLVVKALPEITDFGVNYTQSDLVVVSYRVSQTTRLLHHWCCRR
ncbi:hypothetical protein PC116_g27804 [Phytophthora cactorum]|nr:hypothetical protein PC116_g27804 [Phytophthora cactorum]